MSAFTDRVTDDDIRWLRAQILNDPTDFPRDFTGWLPNWVGLAGLDIPISQITGFSQFAAQTNRVDTSETTTSATYVDLATVGPALTGLPDGSYVILFGAAFTPSIAGNTAAVSVQVNATTAADADAITNTATTGPSSCRAITKTLSGGGNNSVTLKYKVSAGTGTYAVRWLTVLRYANL